MSKLKTRVEPDTDTGPATVTTDAAGESTTTTEKQDTGRDSVSKQTSRERPWAVRAGAALVITCLVAAVVCAVVFGWKLKNRNEIDSAAQQASATAQAYAVTLTSIDAQHIDENFTAVLDGATGEFKDMYAQSSQQLKSLLIQNSARSQGTVVDWSIKSASKNRVQVMMFVDQDVTNSASPEPRVDRSRILMTMDKVDGRWLASKVDMV